MSDYPRMLYRPGTSMRIWGEYDCDARVVADKEEEAAALQKGWSYFPDGRAGPAAEGVAADPALLRQAEGDLQAAAELLEERQAKAALEDKLADALAALAEAVRERDEARAALGKFDRDGNGEPGGSTAKKRSAAKTEG